MLISNSWTPLKDDCPYVLLTTVPWNVIDHMEEFWNDTLTPENIPKYLVMLDAGSSLYLERLPDGTLDLITLKKSEFPESLAYLNPGERPLIKKTKDKILNNTNFENREWEALMAYTAALNIFLKREMIGYLIENPLCSPNSK